MPNGLIWTDFAPYDAKMPRKRHEECSACKCDEGEIFVDFHLETPNQAEAEHAFLDCWFRRTFWDVRIWKEWRKDEAD